MKKNLYIYQKIFLLCMVASLMLLGVGCCVDSSCNDDWDDDNNRYSEEKNYYQEIRLTSQSKFSLESINGRIKIEGTTSDSIVQVWADKEVRAESQWEAEKYMDELDVRVSSNGTGVFVETRHPSKNDITFIVDYHIIVPEGFDVKVDHINGDVTISLIHSNIEVELTNGDLEFFECESNVWAYLTNGKIGADLMLPNDGTCQLSITNGQIELAIPDTTSAEFDARITNGNITLSGLELTSTEVSNKSTKGTLGDGDGLIKLYVTNGTIEVQGQED